MVKTDKLVNSKIFLLLLLFAAFAVKLTVLTAFGNTLFGDLLVLDMEDYDTWAMTVARGQLIGDTAFHGLPFYPYFLGLVYFLLGHSMFLVRFLQILIGSISCVLVFSIAKRLFSPAVGLITFCLMLLFKELYFYEMMLLPITLGIFFYLIIIALMFSVFDRPNTLKIAVLGILTGLSSLNRAYTLFLLPVIPVMLWLFLDKGSKKKYPYIICFMLFAFMAIAPATIHNYMASRDFVPVTAHGGMNLYIGNNPASDGTSVKVLFAVGVGSKELMHDMKLLAEKELARTLKPSEVSAFWQAKTLEFAGKNPGLFFRLLINKINVFFCGFDISDTISYRVLSDHLPFLKIFVFDFID